MLTAMDYRFLFQLVIEVSKDIMFQSKNDTVYTTWSTLVCKHANPLGPQNIYYLTTLCVQSLTTRSQQYSRHGLKLLLAYILYYLEVFSACTNLSLGLIFQAELSVLKSSLSLSGFYELEFSSLVAASIIIRSLCFSLLRILKGLKSHRNNHEGMVTATNKQQLSY